jgi:outer membrane protein assembly factor BamB
MKPYLLLRPLPVLAGLITATFLAIPSPAPAQNSASAKPGGDAYYADPMDWPNWRGPELNGVSREKGLVERWDPHGLNVLWKRNDLGGRSSPICFRGKLYTILRANPDTDIEGERVVCIDAATGKDIWQKVFNVFLSDVPSPRVGWSSVVGDPQTGNVFALGVCGYFLCLDGNTGKVLWEHSLCEEHGIISAFGGRAAFPVVSGNLVYISSVFVDWGDKSLPAQRIIAFDKRNGQMVWYGDTKPRPEDVSYSMPVPTVINGTAQLVLASGDGSIYGLQPRTGKQLWSYNASARGIQATPLVVKGDVFIGQSEENRDDSTMGAFFGIDATKRGDLTTSGELWRDKEIPVDKCSAIPVDGKIFVLDNGGYGLLFDPKNGKLIGEKKKLDTANSASPVYADGMIYLCTLGGIWHTLKLTDHGIDDHKLRLTRPEQGETNASPIISHGRIYQTLPDCLYCIGRKGQDPQADPRPEPPKETPTDTQPTPDQLQIVPAEALLRPGDQQEFGVRLYNARGQYLRDAKPEEVKFSVTGGGSIDAKGDYTTPSGTKPVAVTVKAEVGSLKGSSRVRVIPDLNWKFDFSDGQIPVTWVGVRGRHIPIDYDLLKKIEAKSHLARQLYIYVSSGFAAGRPSLKYDNNTPQQTWTELLRFLDLIEKATSPEKAKAELDPALKVLVDEKVISKFGWPNKKGIELTVERGPRKITGNGVLLKISTIPRGARSQSWFGQTDLHDYTIQSDVCGATRNNRLPDVGVIGQRYSMVLMGDSQKVEIRTWPAHDFRMRKSIPFTWKPETWYTMKFEASNKDSKVTLRGKVWPRGEKEPAAWTVEVTDPSPHPNETGSPGIFGDAQITEIFYDNILVTKNAR